jgi:alpha-amylase/alpha-mannosidase (GH57 family)
MLCQRGSTTKIVGTEDTVNSVTVVLSHSLISLFLELNTWLQDIVEQGQTPTDFFDFIIVIAENFAPH